MLPKRIRAEGFEGGLVRNLYPVTYETDVELIAATAEKITAQLAIERRCLTRAILRGERPSVAAFRKSVDRLERHRRNCFERIAVVNARACAAAHTAYAVADGLVDRVASPITSRAA